MNKEEIKHFKAMLTQGSLRHMNILLDDKFQKELLNIIKDYEKLQQENQVLKRNCNIGNENLSFYMQENKELHNKIDKAVDLLQQYLPNYASCIKLLDELEEILKDSDINE